MRRKIVFITCLSLLSLSSMIYFYISYKNNYHVNTAINILEGGQLGQKYPAIRYGEVSDGLSCGVYFIKFSEKTLTVSFAIVNKTNISKNICLQLNSSGKPKVTALPNTSIEFINEKNEWETGEFGIYESGLPILSVKPSSTVVYTCSFYLSEKLLKYKLLDQKFRVKIDGYELLAPKGLNSEDIFQTNWKGPLYSQDFSTNQFINID